MFWLLHRQRSVGGMALNPIAICDIMAALELYDIQDVYTRRQYTYFVVKLDEVFLVHHANTTASR